MTFLKTLMCLSGQPHLICTMLKYALYKVEPIKLTCGKYKKYFLKDLK